MPPIMKRVPTNVILAGISLTNKKTYVGFSKGSTRLVNAASLAMSLRRVKVYIT